MPLIPILLSDSQRVVEYKVRIAGAVALTSGELTELGRWRAYYSGDHDLLVSDDQQAFLDAVLSKAGRWPIDNKCRVVVNKVASRLDVEGFLLPEMSEDEGAGPQPDALSPSNAAEWAWRWWRDNRLDAGERTLYRTALRDGYAFIIVGHSGTRPRLTLAERWNGTRGVRFFWDDPVMKRDPLYAVRHWYTADPSNLEASNIHRVTVFTHDAIYKYARPTRRQEQYLNIVGPASDEDGLFMVVDSDGEPWPLPWVDGRGEPLGIAVVPFVSPRGSLVEPIIGMQDALNKSWLDLIAAGDQLGFGVGVIEHPGPQPRVMPGDSDDPADDGLGMRPGRWLETFGGAHAHKLPADDLAGLLAFQRATVVSIAANAEQPIYNFIPFGSEVPSGAALDELNRPLAEQAEEVQRPFSDSWREVMRLAQRLDLLYGSSYRGETMDLVVRWREQPVSMEAQQVQATAAEAQRQAQAQIIKLLTDAGAGIDAAATFVKEGLTDDVLAALGRTDVIPPER